MWSAFHKILLSTYCAIFAGSDVLMIELVGVGDKTWLTVGSFALPQFTFMILTCYIFDFSFLTNWTRFEVVFMSLPRIIIRKRLITSKTDMFSAFMTLAYSVFDFTFFASFACYISSCMRFIYIIVIKLFNTNVAFLRTNYKQILVGNNKVTRIALFRFFVCRF